MELPKGKKTTHKIVPWTTGLAQLPWAGGIDDQPFTTMELFGEFMRGDQSAAQKIVSK